MNKLLIIEPNDDIFTLENDVEYFVNDDFMKNDYEKYIIIQKGLLIHLSKKMPWLCASYKSKNIIHNRCKKLNSKKI